MPPGPCSQPETRVVMAGQPLGRFRHGRPAPGDRWGRAPAVALAVGDDPNGHGFRADGWNAAGGAQAQGRCPAPSRRLAFGDLRASSSSDERRICTFTRSSKGKVTWDSREIEYLETSFRVSDDLVVESLDPYDSDRFGMVGFVGARLACGLRPAMQNPRRRLFFSQLRVPHTYLLRLLVPRVGGLCPGPQLCMVALGPRECA